MTFWSSLLCAGAGVAILLEAGPARADFLPACGDAVLSAGMVSCSVETKGGCSAQCTPPNFELACTAKLEGQCTPMCTGSLSASCNTSCQSSCMGGCTANPGNFDCEADCEGTCNGDCSSTCSSMSGDTHCMAECKASCGARCHAGCQGTPPSASCDLQCQASCNGSCTAQANLTCDVQCQASGYVDCTANLSGGCNAQCTAPSGAVFCNGQWVNAADVSSCAQQIEDLFHVKVSGYASSSASCDGGTCQAQAQAGGSASASCDAAPGGEVSQVGIFALALSAGMAGLVRRRVRSAKEPRAK